MRQPMTLPPGDPQETAKGLIAAFGNEGAIRRCAELVEEMRGKSDDGYALWTEVLSIVQRSG